MTQQDKDLIIKLWNNGEPKCVIEKMLPYTIREIRETIKELQSEGLIVGKSGVSQENTIRRIKEIYESGITNPYEIGEIMGHTRQTIEHYLTKAKIKRNRPKHNYKRVQKTTDIIQALQRGEKQSDIARQYNVTRQYIAYVKSKHLKENAND